MHPFRNPKPCLSLFHHLFRFRFRFRITSTLNPFPSKHISSDSNDSTTSDSVTHIDAASSNRKPITLWPGMFHSPAIHALWEARSSIFEKFNANSNVPSVPKTPSRSRTSIFYNFSSDNALREQYRNPWNHIRMGKLVEDFDALAGTIAFKVHFLLFFPKLNYGFW